MGAICTAQSDVIRTTFRASGTAPPGQTFLVFIALSSLSRLFIETFRADSHLLPYGLRLAQVIAWFVLAAALAALLRLPPPLNHW